jgi:hypothetical protein
MADEIIGREDELSVIDAFLDPPLDGLTVLVLECEQGSGSPRSGRLASRRHRNAPSGFTKERSEHAHNDDDPTGWRLT